MGCINFVPFMNVILNLKAIQPEVSTLHMPVPLEDVIVKIIIDDFFDSVEY